MQKDYKVKITLRVDWADLDLFGHVNNVAFFRYVQAGRLNYCEEIGLTALNDPTKHSFMVASSQCRFKKPLLYPGTITIYTKVDWVKNSSFQLSYKLLDQNSDVVAEAEDVLVLFDHHKKQKISIGDALIKRMELMENKTMERLV